MTWLLEQARDHPERILALLIGVSILLAPLVGKILEKLEDPPEDREDEEGPSEDETPPGDA